MLPPTLHAAKHNCTNASDPLHAASTPIVLRAPPSILPLSLQYHIHQPSACLQPSCTNEQYPLYATNQTSQIPS
ncbi:hypothetical protein M758_5G132100 [Ceratodon purpureus]|nr:hypothetical protein M758_5G132100 [Ceratodon purpureus]